MAQWQQDLLDTQATLKARFTTLSEWNASEEFDLMGATDQALLQLEQQAVAQHLSVVSARIAYFT